MKLLFIQILLCILLVKSTFIHISEDVNKDNSINTEDKGNVELEKISEQIALILIETGMRNQISEAIKNVDHLLNC